MESNASSDKNLKLLTIILVVLLFVLFIVYAVVANQTQKQATTNITLTALNSLSFPENLDKTTLDSKEVANCTAGVVAGQPASAPTAPAKPAEGATPTQLAQYKQDVVAWQAKWNVWAGVWNVWISDLQSELQSCYDKQLKTKYAETSTEYKTYAWK